MTDRKTQQQSRQQLVQHLAKVLADSYLLYHTTQFCHWNVVGSQFRPLHEMFEEQYRALAEAIDVIAERIRILGFYAPGTLRDYLTLSSLEQPTDLLAPEEMLEQLIACHEAVTDGILRAVPVAQRISDEATLDLLVERVRAHQKASWMLKSQAGHEFSRVEPGQAVRGASSPKLAKAGAA